MKLLYIAPTRIDLNNLDGVGKKIIAQNKVFSKHFETNVIFRDDENVISFDVSKNKGKRIARGYNRFDILKAAIRYVECNEINVCYIRYPNSDPFFLMLLKKLKNKKVSIVVEIPTYPYDEEGKESVKGKVINKIDKIFRRRIGRFVDRIITYSEDDFIFGIKTIRTVNGLDFNNVALSHSLYNKEEIHLCAVATFHKIHGYDRLIEGLNNYYSNGGTRKVIFDIVGYGDNEVLNDYTQLVDKYNLNNNVIFHGKVFGSNLDLIYETASIGINSLAIHRQNLIRESTLKTREYAAKGLPILTTSFIDAFDIDGNEKYVLNIEANDSPVDIERVIDFCDEIYNRYDCLILRNSIREKSRKICDMSVTLSGVITFFLESNLDGD